MEEFAHVLEGYNQEAEDLQVRLGAILKTRAQPADFLAASPYQPLTTVTNVCKTDNARSKDE